MSLKGMYQVFSYGDFSWYLDHGPYRFFLVKFLLLNWALCLELCSRAGKQDMAVGNVLVSSFLLGFSSLTIQEKKKMWGGNKGIVLLLPGFLFPRL